MLSAGFLSRLEILKPQALLPASCAFIEAPLVTSSAQDVMAVQS